MPHVAMSDVFQGATLFNRTFQGVTYNTMTDPPIGVVTFKWVASNGFPGNNLTDTQAQQLWGAGFAPLALFTGNATGNGTVRNGDQLKVVYATGRDPDSGTRLSAFADAGIGALATVVQYKATVSGDTVTGLVKYPIQVINGVSTGSLGNSGESSGSSLRAFMNKTLTASAYQTEDTSATGGYLMTYLGVSDANTVLPGGSGAGAAPAVELNVQWGSLLDAGDSNRGATATGATSMCSIAPPKPVSPRPSAITSRTRSSRKPRHS